MSLLSAADFPSIRASLDSGLTATDLPDATIALDVFQGAGEAALLAADPEAATRSGSALAAAKRAAILFTAALLAPTVALVTQEQLPDYSYQRQVATWQQRAGDLRARANAEIDGYLSVGRVDAERPVMFALALGNRGR